MNTRTKLLFTAPIALGLMAAAWTVPPANPPANVELRGSVTGWSITEDGSVYMRLRDLGQSSSPATWFVTPPSQTAATQFEELVLDAVLKLHSRSQPKPGAAPPVLTVIGDVSNEETGRTPEQAIPLVRLSQL